jgi:hypothetical protein
MRYAWILLLVACGSGGGAAVVTGPDDGLSGIAAEPLAITTAALPGGNAGKVFFVQLAAAGGAAPYAWSLSTAGDVLPDGLGLTAAGAIAGVPSGTAVRTLVLEVRDAEGGYDVVSLALEVRDVVVAGPSTALLPGEQAALGASGGAGEYTFTFATNATGAALRSDGLYTAGAEPGMDVVRATDADGFYDELALTVGEDPFAGFVETWGTTDVWWVDWDVSYDSTPAYATDLDEALVALGLRSAQSTGAAGTEADDLARRLLIRRTLGHISAYYGNGFDGNPQQGGLSLSIVGPAGLASGTTPNAGHLIGAAPFRYSTICVRHGPTDGVLGTAVFDPGNVLVEHDCGSTGGTALGVFVNELVGPYHSAFGSALAPNPVGASDAAGLRAMLLGAAPSGARQQLIFRTANDFGRVLGTVIAHEIGHSLGLAHSQPSTGPGDIMNAKLNLGGSVAYAFSAGHWAALQKNLPGPNR